MLDWHATSLLCACGESDLPYLLTVATSVSKLCSAVVFSENGYIVFICICYTFQQLYVFSVHFLNAVLLNWWCFLNLLVFSLFAFDSSAVHWALLATVSLSHLVSFYSPSPCKQLWSWKSYFEHTWFSKVQLIFPRNTVMWLTVGVLVKLTTWNPSRKIISAIKKYQSLCTYKVSNDTSGTFPQETSNQRTCILFCALHMAGKSWILWIRYSSDSPPGFLSTAMRNAAHG